MRDLILSEIRRLAEIGGGKAPGKSLFARETGISESQWRGIIWARWSDAVSEAGYRPNELQPRFDSDFMLRKIAESCRYYGRLPTIAEMKLYRQRDTEFPSKGAVANHFQTQSDLGAALLKWCNANEGYADVAAVLPPKSDARLNFAVHNPKVPDGWVYLVRSGMHYKIGRSDELERRVKEIRIALPEAATLIHAIQTDDPSGIEAYWHRRFADRRANGEWFKLSAADVAAFKKRKYQ